MNKKALASFVAIIVAIGSTCIYADSIFGLRGLNLSANADVGRNFQTLVVAETDYAIVRTVCDVDGDGFNDVIGANLGEGFNDVIGANLEGGLMWYSYPDWGKYVIGEFNWNAEDIKSADIDSDGDYDVVGLQDYAVCWYENPLPNGNPRESWKSHYIGTCDAMVTGFDVADLNNDGKLDVVARQFGTKLLIFEQNTPEMFSAIATVDIHGSDGLAMGDLDNDADVDIVLNGFWLENPCPNMTLDWTLHEIDSKWWNQSNEAWYDNNARVAVADLNQDGKMDVLLSNSEKPGYPISWYETSNPASGLWTEHVIGQLDYCHTLLVGDLNLDGFPDVVAAKFERHWDSIPPPYNVQVYYNSGYGLSWTIVEVSDLGMYQGGLADIGNDGDLDIVGSRSYWKGPIEIFVNSASTEPIESPTEAIEVPKDTIKPTASAGPDQTVNENTKVTLDGSASKDNIGVVSYSWTFKDEINQNLTGKTPSYTFNTPGVYNITLTVKDEAGNTATDKVSVTVLDITLPVANAGLNQYTLVGTTASFNASASRDNVGITSYEWDFGDGATGTGKIVTHDYASGGTYTVVLTVIDQAGNIGTDTMRISVSSSEIDQLLAIGLLISLVTIGFAVAFLLLKKKGSVVKFCRILLFLSIIARAK